MFKRDPDEYEVRRLYKKLAPMIVRDAAKQNIKLDYSIGSFKLVDSILFSLHQEYIALGKQITKQQEESYQGYTEMLGCYMLAVVDKNKVAGKLTIVNDEYGTAYGFTFSSGVFSDFISWCGKALLNGKIDAIEPKFKLFSKS